MRLWGGRFGEPSDPRAIEFGRSIEVDRELAQDDIAGSVAHVHGLGRAGILTADEVKTLISGLDALGADLEAGRIDWDPALEDVHLNRVAEPAPVLVARGDDHVAAGGGHEPGDVVGLVGVVEHQ